MKIIGIPFPSLLVIFFCLFYISNANSQQKSFEVIGQIVSKEDGEPLESATVYLERERDSTLNTYTITDRNGNFLLIGKTYEDELSLFVSYVGYAPQKQIVAINAEKIQLPAPIQLQTDANSLEEIVIRSVAPITIKKDTLEFNAASFKTRAGATVEDLLKELPGVEVDLEGNITVNGKPVNKLLVNGKPFFGDDPTIATRNLTKEMIEKVQVMDTKTDAEAFAGEEGDQENKTVNLTISEEKNKGTFGRLSAGGGTDERFEYAGLINRFDGDRRLSILGGGNNTNSPGFSFGEIQKMFGGGSTMSVSSTGFSIDGRSFGFGNGIINSRNAGATYADAYGEYTDISVDYFYSGANTNDRLKRESENIFPETRFFTNSESTNKTENDRHSANLKFDIKPDSTWLINIKPSFQYATSQNRRVSEEETLNELGELTNQNNLQNSSENTNRNFKNDLGISKKFGSKGASFRFNLTNEWDEQESDDRLNAETLFFDETTENDLRNQLTDRNQTLNSFYTSLTYQHPLIAKEFFLNFTYSLRSDIRKSQRSTFDFNEETQTFDAFNALLSTDFRFKNQRSTPGIGLSYRKEKWSLSLSGSYVSRTLEIEDQLRPELNLKNNFDALEYTTYFNYRFKSSHSIYTGYTLSNAPPQIDQLQPFQDVSDPLNIKTGNPNLEPTNTHSIYTGYNAYNFQSGSGFNFYSNMNFVNNQVVSKTSIDENFVRNTTYTNVNGSYRANFSGFYSKNVKLDTLHSVKFTLSNYLVFNRTVGFNEDEKYKSTVRTVNPRFQFTYTWKDVFEITPNYTIGFTRTKYDIEAFDNRTFTNHNVGLNTATFLPKNVEWRNIFNYRYNPDVAPGFESSFLFWNTSVSYSFMQEQAMLTFKIYDVLKQNTNAVRTSNENVISDTQSTVLQQYFMLSFSWKFNSLGKKGETEGASPFFNF